jgi:hypothetical protein
MVVRNVRGAFSSLLSSVVSPPGAAHKPQEISRQLGLNKNLAWKISKIVQAEDPVVALRQMPGEAGISIFLRAVEQAGANPALLTTAREAVKQYEQLIRVHSGDRATLEMLGSTLSPARQQSNDEQHRKLLFQGASFVWGAQARVILKIGLVGPSGSESSAPGHRPGELDFASLNCLIDFRRLRPDVTWIMASRNSNNDDGSDMRTSRLEAIDERYSDAEHAPLMADFCSQPLPTLRRFVDGALFRYELVEGPVGNTGALTCAVGAIQRRIPYYRTPTNEWGVHLASCDIPAELLILDLFLHRDFTFAIPPEPILYSHQCHVAPEPQRDRYRLPLNEPLQDLGTGLLAPATPEVPHYDRMLKAMFDRMAWSPDEFHGFRMNIAYPAYPTAVALRYPLPDPPGELAWDRIGRT